MRVVLAGFGIALGALTAWLWWTAPPGQHRGPTHADRTTATAPTAVAAIAERRATPPARTDITAAAGLEAADREPVVAVRVVERATGTPVVGAEVRCAGATFDWNELDDADNELATRLAGLDDEALLQRFGCSVATDAAGLARLPPLGDHGIVCARRGGDYGAVAIDDDPDEPGNVYVLAIEPDLTLEVTGIPPDLPIAVRGTVRDLWSHAENEGVWTTRAIEEVDDRLVVRHLQTRQPWRHGPAGLPRLTVGPALAGFDQVPVVWQDRIGHAHVELPPLGSVDVRVRAPTGVAPRLEAIELSVVTPPGGDHAPHEPSRLDRDAGLATFSWVPIGQRIVVRATVDGLGLEHCGPGPQRVGERVAIAFVADSIAVSFVGRMVDDQGRPLAHRPVVAALATGTTWAWASANTDADGRFRIERTLPTIHVPIGRIRLIAEHEAHSTTAERNGPFAAGTHELGAIALDLADRRRPIVASGTIVGLPHGSSVRAQVERSHGPSAWWPDPDASFSHDGSAFVVRANADDAARRLWLSADTWSADPVVFSAGTRDLVVEPWPTGALKVELGLGGIRPDAVLVRLSCDGRTLAMRPDSDIVSLGRLLLAWHALRPAHHEISVHTRGDPRPLATVATSVEGGRTTWLRGERAFDLRGRLRSILVTLTDADGAPLAGAHGAAFVVDPLPQDPREWQIGFAGSRVELVTARGHVDLLVIADGHAPALVRGLTADTAVALAAEREVAFGVAVSPTLPPGFALRLRATLDAPSGLAELPSALRSVAGTRSNLPRAEVWTLDPGDALPLLPGTTFDIVAELLDGDGATHAVSDPARFLVLAGRGPQRVEVPVSSERVRAATSSPPPRRRRSRTKRASDRRDEPCRPHEPPGSSWCRMSPRRSPTRRTWSNARRGDTASPSTSTASATRWGCSRAWPRRAAAWLPRHRHVARSAGHARDARWHLRARLGTHRR